MRFDLLSACVLRTAALAMLSMMAMPGQATAGPLCGGQRQHPPMACHAGGTCLLDDRRLGTKRLQPT